MKRSIFALVQAWQVFKWHKVIICQRQYLWILAAFLNNFDPAWIVVYCFGTSNAFFNVSMTAISCNEIGMVTKSIIRFFFYFFTYDGRDWHTFVNKSFHTGVRPTKESTLMRNHLASQSVTRNSVSAIIWRLMKESTLKRNHSAAQSVTRNLDWVMIWRPMKEYTLVRNHSVAQSVTSHSVKLLIWRPMKEYTQMRNLSSAQSVTTNLPRQLV